MMGMLFGRHLVGVNNAFSSCLMVRLGEIFFLFYFCISAISKFCL